MRKYLSVYNLLGLLVFALGLFVYWQSPVPNPPKALPLPADEAAREEKLTLNLYRPDPPRGFLREPVVLEVGLGGRLGPFAGKQQQIIKKQQQQIAGLTWFSIKKLMTPYYLPIVK